LQRYIVKERKERLQKIQHFYRVAAD